MICCIIAAYLYARMVAMLRRWAIYWGIVRRGPFERDLPTLCDNLRGKGPRPALSTLCLTAAIVALASTWSLGGFDRPDAAGPAQDSSIPRLAQLIGV